MIARHRRLHLRQMAELQKRFPCAAQHPSDVRGFDPDTNGHNVKCYPSAQVTLVQREISSPD